MIDEDNSDKVQQDPKVESLLNEFEQSRKDLRKDLEDLTGLKDKLGTLFPTELNYRNKHILEEKIKTVTSFVSTILNIRQEINKTIISEIEIRRKIVNKEDNKVTFDIRSLAGKIEKIKSGDLFFDPNIQDKSDVEDMVVE